MQVEEIRSSQGKTVLALLTSLAFVFLAVVLPADDVGERYKLWFGGAFFGLASLVFVLQLIRPQRLLLAPEGFTVAGGLVRSPKEVRWGDVEPFFVYRLPKGGKMIGYNFAPGAGKKSTLIRVNRWAGAEGVLPKGWPGSPEKLVERINAYRARALAAQTG